MKPVIIKRLKIYIFLGLAAGLAGVLIVMGFPSQKPGTRKTDASNPQERITEKERFNTFLCDRDASVKDRRRAVWVLAKDGDSKVLRSLEKVLFKGDIPGHLKVAVVEGLSYSCEVNAKKIMFSALEDEDENVVCAAIRGLSTIGDERAVSVLSDIIHSGKASGRIIAEAAHGLGNMDHAKAYHALVNIYEKAAASNNIDLEEDIISALGHRDISETGEFFERLLEEEDMSKSFLRVAVVAAVQDSQGNTGPVLLHGLTDENSAVRAEAARGLAVAEEPGGISDDLLAQLAKEDNPEVRKYLYQSLGNQENVHLGRVIGSILREADPDARMAGYDLLASHIRNAEDEKIKELFDKTILKDLQQTALSDERLGSKLSAVLALKRANTAKTIAALEEIAARSPDMRVVKATGVNR